MNLSDIRAVSLPRPWPGLVLGGFQLVTRRATPWRGALVLHAARRIDAAAPEITTPAAYARGLVGVAHLVDVHSTTECDYPACGGHRDRRHGAFHWVTRSPITFPAAIPAHGKQKLFSPTRQQQDVVRMHIQRSVSTHS